jgi:hypothetical protein
MRHPVLLILFLAGQPALAGSNLFCRPLSDLRKQVQDCEQNDYFAEAGVVCMQNFQERAKTAAASLGLGTDLNAQNQAEQRTKTDLDRSSKQLGLLILEGAGRMAEILDYSKNILLPEDADSPQFAGPNLRAFLSDSRCYRRAASVLEAVLEDMQRNLSKLKNAQAMLAKASGVAASRSTSLDSAGPGAAKSTRGKGGALPAGSDKPQTNDVTGVQEAIQGDKKKP